MGRERDVRAQILWRDHKEVLVEGLGTCEFALNCSQDTGQHRCHMDIGGFRPVQQGNEALIGQRTEQIIEEAMGKTAVPR